jgi:hypothetical protein
MNLDYIFFAVMIFGWIMLIGLWVLFMRRAPKDGPDPGPNARVGDADGPDREGERPD